jgi:RimJ/RimL family protein N-acetyltransferase
MSSNIVISEGDILNASSIQLEPIANHHRDGLCKAANYEQIWQFMPQKATKELFNPWFNSCLDKMATREQITYVVRQKASQTIVGATAYYAIQLEHKSLALGYSWYSPNTWGSTINPEAKLLMLTQAFESWGINRVEIGTDSRNQRSYNAIKKLGATEEGLLRQHMILHNEVLTDTIVFSILRSEWPIVKMKLITRITNKELLGKTVASE